jgi:hypothetical protein
MKPRHDSGQRWGVDPDRRDPTSLQVAADLSGTGRAEDPAEVAVIQTCAEPVGNAEERAAYEWGLCLATRNRADLDLGIRRGLRLGDDASTSDVHQAAHVTDGRSATAQAAAYHRAYKDLLVEQARRAGLS